MMIALKTMSSLILNVLGILHWMLFNLENKPVTAYHLYPGKQSANLQSAFSTFHCYAVKGEGWSERSCRKLRK